MLFLWKKKVDEEKWIHYKYFFKAFKPGRELPATIPWVLLTTMWWLMAPRGPPWWQRKSPGTGGCGAPSALPRCPRSREISAASRTRESPGPQEHSKRSSRQRILTPIRVRIRAEERAQDPRDLAYLGDDLKTRCIQLHRDDEQGHLVAREPPGVESKRWSGDISEYWTFGGPSALHTAMVGSLQLIKRRFFWFFKFFLKKILIRLLNLISLFFSNFNFSTTRVSPTPREGPGGTPGRCRGAEPLHGGVCLPDPGVTAPDHPAIAITICFTIVICNCRVNCTHGGIRGEQPSPKCDLGLRPKSILSRKCLSPLKKWSRIKFPFNSPKMFLNFLRKFENFYFLQNLDKKSWKKNLSKILNRKIWKKIFLSNLKFATICQEQKFNTNFLLPCFCSPLKKLYTIHVKSTD